MRRRLRFFVSTGLAGWLAFSATRAAETPGQIAAFGEIVLSILPQAATERAACESMLAVGVEQGMWNEEEKRAAEDWLSYVFGDVAPETPGEKSPASEPDSRWQQIVQRAIRPVDPTAATSPVLLWLRERFGALKGIRETVLACMIHSAVEAAESAWLSAKSADDLASALRGIGEVKAVLGFKWPEIANRHGDSSQGEFVRQFRITYGTQDVWDLHDCWSIIGSPEPLLLPDPVADPASFALARRNWLGLIQTSHHFVKRPAVNRRFTELNNRFHAQFADIERDLDAAILRDAPAAEFENQFKRLQSHLVPATLPDRAFKISPNGNARGPLADTPPDYRTRLSRQPMNLAHIILPDGREERELRCDADYAGWLEWRKATEEGNAERIQKAKTALLTKVNTFVPRVAGYLGKRLAAVPKPRPETDYTARHHNL